MSNPFAAPAPAAGGITWADHLGALLVIEPQAFEEGIKTSFGDASAVRADVYVIDGAGAGTDYEDTLVFPKILASQLKSKVGQKVIGRLGQGNAKPGQSAPWLLVEASESDVTRGAKWLTERDSDAFAAPAAAGAPPF